MKRTFGRYLLAAGVLMVLAPAAVQAQKTAKPVKEKKEVKQIIITRIGDDVESTIVEIKGDKVTVNGKDVKDMGGDNIRVDINRLKDMDALVMAPGMPHPPRVAGAPRVYNFQHGEDGGFDFYGEDSSRAMLGVVTAEDDRGARINDVSKESGAEKAGLKKGDIITRIDDAAIKNAGDVTEQVRKHKPGDKVTVVVLRDGKEQKLVAELTKWKGLKINAQNFRVMMPSRVAPFEPNDRIELHDLNFEMEGFGRPRMGISVQDSEDGKGVVVQDVDEESNAAKAGIKEGDIITRFNDTEINDVTVLRRELVANKDKISAKIQLMRNGKEQTVDVKMPRRLRSADL